MNRTPRIKTAMTPFPESISIEARIETAREWMEEHEMHHLPVRDGDALVGVLSARDVGEVLNARDSEETGALVRDAYTPDPYVVDLDTPLVDVLNHMATEAIGSALVTRLGKLVGIFTTTDACRIFAEHLRELDPEPGPPEIA